MPLIQLELPKDLDAKIKHYMIDNDFEDKRLAIIHMLRKYR